MIPLILKLKKKGHKDIAQAQDLIVEELFNVFNNDAVLHGGTAIWRCYNGNRFSEDVDAFLPKDMSRINLFFISLEKRGFIILKKKIGENSVYSNLKLNSTIVRFESTFRIIKGTLKEYLTVDSNLIVVYTLTPEELIKGKVNAYLNRRKIRDIYDIFFLLRHIKNNKAVKNDLKKLINKFKPPIDPKELKVLILEGVVPTVEDMFNYIQRWI